MSSPRRRGKLLAKLPNLRRVSQLDGKGDLLIRNKKIGFRFETVRSQASRRRRLGETQGYGDDDDNDERPVDGTVPIESPVGKSLIHVGTSSLWKYQTLRTSFSRHRGFSPSPITLKLRPDTAACV